MLYNDIITYNHNNVSYIGTLYLNIVGFSNPIILNNVNVIFTNETDFSNATTIGIVSYDISPSGIITISGTESQLYGVSDSSTIYLVPQSESSASFESGNTAESGGAVMYVEPVALIEIDNLNS